MTLKAGTMITLCLVSVCGDIFLCVHTINQLLLSFHSLSRAVRDGDTVKHYRIRQLDEGGFFIARRTTFR